METRQTAGVDGGGGGGGVVAFLFAKWLLLVPTTPRRHCSTPVCLSEQCVTFLPSFLLGDNRTLHTKYALALRDTSVVVI